MSISCGCFKAEVVLRCEVIVNLSQETYGQESRANNDMEAVEARCDEKGGSVDSVCDGKWGFIVLHALKEGEVKA